jgi:hypothetical protein
MNIAPTYFLYSGRLFHEAAIPFLEAQMAGEDSNVPSLPNEDPSPEGPPGESVGEDEETESDEDDDTEEKSVKPSPGPGMPMVPEHGAPDANPIDPRVFTGRGPT